MKNKILTVLSVLLALLFLNAGFNKFFNYLPVPEGLPDDLMRDNAALMEISWLGGQHGDFRRAALAPAQDPRTGTAGSFSYSGGNRAHPPHGSPRRTDYGAGDFGRGAVDDGRKPG
jgi:hypothetical protein